MAFKLRELDPELDHIRPEIKKRLANPEPITAEEYSEMRVNSYEQEALYPRMTVDCLLRTVQHSLNHCSGKFRPGPCTTYDEAVIHVFAPLLLKRLEKLNRALETVLQKDLNAIEEMKGMGFDVPEEALQVVQMIQEALAPAKEAAGNIQPKVDPDVRFLRVRLNQIAELLSEPVVNAETAVARARKLAEQALEELKS